MKTLKQLLLVFTAVMLLFTSCKTAKTSLDMALSIPDDAVFVATFNNKQIIEKGELNKFKEFNLYGIFRKEIARESDKLATMFDEFISNTRTSGLNLDQSYIYGVGKGGKNPSFKVVFMFKMDDVKTFEGKLKELMSAGGGGEEPANRGNYRHLNLGYDGNIVWNDNMLYVVVGDYNWDDEDNVTDYNYLFTENPKNIMANADFALLASKQHDVSFWASYSKFVDMMGGASGLSTAAFRNMMVVDITNMNLHASLNFNKGEAKLAANVTPREKVEEMLKQYKVVKSNFDNDLLKYFPEQSFTVMKMSVNVQEYIRLLKDQAAKIAQVSREQYRERYGDDDDYYYDPMEEMNEILENKSFKIISEGLEGDAVLSLYGFQQGMIPMPLASLVFNVKDKNVFDEIVSLLPEEVLRKQNDYYAIMSGPMSFGFLAFKDNKIFATTEEEALKNFLAKGYDKNLGHSALAKDLKSDIFLWNVNIDLDAYPEHIKLMLQSTMRREYALFQSLISIYKSLDYKVTKDYSGEIIVKTKGDSNALKTILKNLDENIPTIMGK